MMTFLKKIFNFYINASIHVALAVYAFVRITELYFNLPYNEAFNYFLFYGTIVAYNFVKYFEIVKSHYKNLNKELKIIQLVTFCSLVLSGYYAYFLSLKIILFVLFFGLLTVLYAVPLSGAQKNLRHIGYLKIVIVALVWAGTTALLPIVTTERAINTEIILFVQQRFLLVVILILPFDIRDMQLDMVSLQTIPKKIGIQNTKKLGFVLLLFSMVIEFFLESNSEVKNVFLVVILVTLFLLMRAKKEQSNYYSSFWVEAIPIFWWISLTILN